MDVKAMDIGNFDPALHQALEGELRRQEEHIEFIANGAEPVVQRVRTLVLKLCQRYPVYSTPWHNPPGTV